jgi:hypothetical protein
MLISYFMGINSANNKISFLFHILLTSQPFDTKMCKNVLYIVSNWGDPGEERRIILRWVFRKWDVCMDWIELAQDRDRWTVLLNAVMNLRVS